MMFSVNSQSGGGGVQHPLVVRFISDHLFFVAWNEHTRLKYFKVTSVNY